MNVFLDFVRENWIDLLISLSIVVGGYVLSRWLVKIPIRWVSRRTATTLDDVLLKAIERPLSLLVFIVGFQVAGLGFVFLPTEAQRETTEAVFFILYTAIGTCIVWQVINAGIDWYAEHIPPEADEEAIARVLPIGKSLARMLVLAVALTTLLARLGVNITAISTSLGIAGLAVSLAARQTFEDLIGGILIILDQPFRLGDRIDIPEIGTWGDVERIGFRSCRIRTRDNRVVIIPNSKIATNQVINYSYPDPRYRNQIELGIGYANDIEEVRHVIVDAVSKVEGVLLDKPVDALFLEFGDSAMIFRVRWWIGAYTDARRMFDTVNTAMYQSLTGAGAELPFTTYDVNVKIGDEDVNRISDAVRQPNQVTET